MNVVAIEFKSKRWNENVTHQWIYRGAELPLKATCWKINSSVILTVNFLKSAYFLMGTAGLLPSVKEAPPPWMTSLWHHWSLQGGVYWYPTSYIPITRLFFFSYVFIVNMKTLSGAAFTWLICCHVKLEKHQKSVSLCLTFAVFCHCGSAQSMFLMSVVYMDYQEYIDHCSCPEYKLRCQKVRMIVSVKLNIVMNCLILTSECDRSSFSSTV